MQAFAAGMPFVNAMITSLIIGNYMGPDALAAIGFYGPFRGVLVAVGTMLAMGSQLLCARYCIFRTFPLPSSVFAA